MLAPSSRVAFQYSGILEYHARWCYAHHHMAIGKVKVRALTHRERRTLQEELRITVRGLSHRMFLTFLLSFLTPSERVMLARRLQIARRLIAERTYEDIRRELHVGLDTIQEVDRWLQEKPEELRALLQC